MSTREHNGSAAALKVAINLLLMPSRVRPMRSAPLPDGMVTLLEIAARDAEATNRASEQSGRTQEMVRDAATFFIEQILLAPDSDSYRVLGASPQASSGELRRNMALLLRWLHPDMEHNGRGTPDRSMFAGRVTLAWDNLKSADRRAAYDAEQQSRRAKASLRRSHAGAHGKSGKPWSGKQGNGGAHSGKRNAPHRGVKGQPPAGRLWRALMGLFGRAKH